MWQKNNILKIGLQALLISQFKKILRDYNMIGKTAAESKSKDRLGRKKHPHFSYSIGLN